MANKYLGINSATKLTLEISLDKGIPIIEWGHIEHKLARKVKELLQEGHKQFKVTLEALD